MDLTRGVTFRGYQLNSVTNSTSGLVGCRIDECDLSEVDVQQFSEPLALAQGVDVGGVWLRARHVKMSGAIFDITRGKAFDRLYALEAIMVPNADYVATPANMGFGALVYYVVQNAAPGYASKTLYARSNGLRYDFKREMFGGVDTAPLAIPWSVSFVCKNPIVA